MSKKLDAVHDVFQEEFARFMHELADAVERGEVEVRQVHTIHDVGNRREVCMMLAGDFRRIRGAMEFGRNATRI